MQILPRSILPYSMVPMTRLDPVEKKQVLTDTMNVCYYK